MTADKEEVILLIFHFRLLLNGCHITRLVLGLFRSPLDRMDQAKRSSSTGKAAKLTCRYEKAYVVLGRGHNLRRRKLELIQSLHDHWVKRKLYVVVKDRPIDCDTFLRRFIHSCVCLRDYKSISHRQKIHFLQGRSLQGRRDLRIGEMHAQPIQRVQKRYKGMPAEMKKLKEEVEGYDEHIEQSFEGSKEEVEDAIV
ncbi:hypothetical protein Cgig2_006333 [Carnegiea gigantea]|uniref:Uncharacterized protein n=1 Tax=Carnegiea gigantea TaxID=171969 RepID=A0A9Q1GKE4_9CARY|nr:hypothetical protein Cgig2_006333 [Carnegiea gigantea]